MGKEKKVFVVGKQGSIQKTLMVFSFSDKQIVWSWSEPRITMDGRNDPVDIHRTYHETGEIVFTARMKGHVHHSVKTRHKPLNQFKGPVLFGVAHGHYLDFQGFQIKHFDPRRAVNEKIILDLEESNYLGLKVSAYLLDKESDDDSTIYYNEDNQEIYIVRKVSPWLKLIIKRLNGIELNERGFRIV